MSGKGVCGKDGGGAEGVSTIFILLFYIRAEMRVVGWKMRLIVA